MRKPLVSNGAPFANTNECMFREFHSDVNYTVRNLYNGDTYVNGVDREEDEIMLLADYIQSAMTERYTRESKGVHATFRTDASCIFAQTTSTNVSYLNRGYLTLTVDNDADLASYKKLNKLARVEDIRPGNTYTFVIESVWMINIAQGMPWRMGTFDRTNGTYTQI